MTIFGKNGLWAAGLYVGTLYALYGQKQAGFAKSEDVDAIDIVAARKNKTPAADYRANKLRGASDKRYAEMLKDGKFAEAYQKKEWLR